jgi:hypothetical protein
MSSNQILSFVDYVENYFFQWQNEIQSQHWFSFQVTILVHLSFRIHEHREGNLDTKIVIEYHFYINNDKLHDNFFCSSVLGYTCNTSKTKATHSL